MTRYCTKYVEIDAIRWDGGIHGDNGADFITIWSNGQVGCKLESINPCVVVLEVCTLEGIMKASPGDYIVRGLRGEYYPCKPDVFEMKYKEVSDGKQSGTLSVGGEVPSKNG